MLGLTKSLWDWFPTNPKFGYMFFHFASMFFLKREDSKDQLSHFVIVFRNRFPALFTCNELRLLLGLSLHTNCLARWALNHLIMAEFHQNQNAAY
jgi:hypothetical protein